jgi:A/G-specific adenine glycosylase
VDGALIDTTTARDFRRRLVRWYRRNARDLPWRRTRDPYRILVSEVMLQQTQVARVLDYYQRFLTRFPTLESLARARPSRVREAWDGLGYYARARSLHRIARSLAGDDRSTPVWPNDVVRLRAFPGIGPYTAAAVASFAFERRVALVDTNVARVLTRVFDPSCQPRTTEGTRRVWHLAEALLPRTGPAAWTHNQALMELGALVCSARSPQCGSCPVRRHCRTAAASEK